ncbi:MAG: class I SAM-dependent methyltransferase [Mycobacteriaceae bacterium]
MSREREHAHPVFAQVYRLVAAAGERGGYGRLRASVLTEASGRLLILGLGPGHDLAHLPAAVTSVVAIEPDPSMRALARGRVAACPVPVTLLSADAHDLPLADGSIDAVLCACVLCSVAQPPRTLAELRRILVPGGRLLLLEHVAAPQGHWVGRLQQLLEPVWGRAAGGCSIRRDTRAAVAGAGFDTTAVSTTMVWPNVPPIAPTVLGTAFNR